MAAKYSTPRTAALAIASLCSLNQMSCHCEATNTSAAECWTTSVSAPPAPPFAVESNVDAADGGAGTCGLPLLAGAAGEYLISNLPSGGPLARR